MYRQVLRTDWTFDARRIALGGTRPVTNIGSSMVPQRRSYRSIVLPFRLLQVLRDRDVYIPHSMDFDPIRAATNIVSPLHWTFGEPPPSDYSTPLNDLLNFGLDLEGYFRRARHRPGRARTLMVIETAAASGGGALSAGMPGLLAPPSTAAFDPDAFRIDLQQWSWNTDYLAEFLFSKHWGRMVMLHESPSGVTHSDARRVRRRGDLPVLPLGRRRARHQRVPRRREHRPFDRRRPGAAGCSRRDAGDRDREPHVQPAGRRGRRQLPPAAASARERCGGPGRDLHRRSVQDGEPWQWVPLGARLRSPATSVHPAPSKSDPAGLCYRPTRARWTLVSRHGGPVAGRQGCHATARSTTADGRGGRGRPFARWRLRGTLTSANAVLVGSPSAISRDALTGDSPL